MIATLVMYKANETTGVGMRTINKGKMMRIKTALLSMMMLLPLAPAAGELKGSDPFFEYKKRWMKLNCPSEKYSTIMTLKKGAENDKKYYYLYKHNNNCFRM